MDYLKYATTFTLYELRNEISKELQGKNKGYYLQELHVIKCNEFDSKESYKVILNKKYCLSKQGVFIYDRNDFNSKELLKYRFESLELAFAAAEKIVKKLFNNIKKN